jgi:methyl-accepting chemotaxis protein
MFSWFNNMKVGSKLMLGFSAMGLIMAIVGYMGVTNMGTITQSTDNIYNVQLKPLMTLTKVRGLVYQMRSQTITALLTANVADREDSLAKVKELNKLVDETRENFSKSIKAEAVQKAYDDFAKVYDDYRAYRDNTVFRLLLAGDHTGALAAMKGDGAVKFKASIDAINNLVDVKVKIAQGKYDEAQAIYANSKMLLTGIIIGGIALGLFLGWIIARMVANPLRQVGDVALSAAEGNLTRRVSCDTKDEIGTMAKAFNDMMERLTAVVTTVRHATDSVGTASEQITKGNEDLAQRTSEQASALEETSASMEELTSTVKQNADNAKQANQLAIAARDIADKGGAITTRAVDAMGEINKSSKKIADIITVIDEIAFQTNLLALNAAVEAARAGEHGRGFAVVAAEVRNLAQRSATAAKEIKGLINESIQRVTDGSELVNQSGKTLDEIVSSVKRVTDIIAEITAASQEQASGIDQVNKAIMQMDETTQQNAALVEETTSASQSMKEQAKDLTKEMGFFTVSDHGGTAAPQPSATRRAAAPASNGLLKRLTKSPSAKPAEKADHASSHEPVGIASGNGKDRRQSHDDFEEF